jgi:hypothetical protein
MSHHVVHCRSMAKKVTLESLDARFTKLAELIERGFEAVAEDIGTIKSEIAATREQTIAVHGHVNAIEGQLREMKYVKLQGRVADLEEEVFGDARA